MNGTESMSIFHIFILATSAHLGELLFNGALHWLVYSNDNNILVVVAFDLIQRSLYEIPVFDHFTLDKYNNGCRLSDIGGCLNVCYLVKDCARTEIWVMKEYKVHCQRWWNFRDRYDDFKKV